MKTRAELERLLEQANSRCDSLVDRIKELKRENLYFYDKLEAERNELKKRMEKMKYDFDFINSDRNILKADNEKLKVECNGNTELKEKLQIAEGELDRTLDRVDELKDENSNLKEHIKSLDDIILKLKDERGDCFEDCSACEVKCRAWQNGFNAKGGNMSFDSVQMLHRIVEEVTPEWYGNNCINCAWFNNLKGVGGYCAYHNNKTTAKGGCNKWCGNLVKESANDEVEADDDEIGGDAE